MLTECKVVFCSHIDYCVYFCFKDAAVESLTTVRPYSNEIHAQVQLWLKKDPKASYDAWKKCLLARSEFP